MKQEYPDHLEGITEKEEKNSQMDKSTLLFLIDKLIARRQEAINNVVKKVGNCANLNKSKIVPLLILTAIFACHTQGYCADDVDYQAIGSITNKVLRLVLDYLRYPLVTFSAIFGIFQMVRNQNVTHLIIWGGISLTIVFLEPLVNIFSKF